MVTRMPPLVCERCRTQGVMIVPDPDEPGSLIHHCIACGHETFIPGVNAKKPTPEPTHEDFLAESKRPPTMSAQQRAMRRYRRTDLFRQTNKVIQQRWRNSERGKATIQLNNDRMRALRHLVAKIYYRKTSGMKKSKHPRSGGRP